MTLENEPNRLSSEEWHAAVNRALHVHDETHAISIVRARKHVPALAEMVSECGVSGMVLALGSAIRFAALKDRSLDYDPLLTEKTAGRVSRFAKTLRLRRAGDEVRNDLAPDVFDEDERVPYEPKPFSYNSPGIGKVFDEIAAQMAKDHRLERRRAA